jgi:hypothetical protein
MNTNKAKHTPGPWKYIAWGQQISIDGIEEMGIAKINTLGFNDKGIPSRQDVANAALIAAAPELLAALEFCSDALNTEAGGLYEAHIKQARAAIAKAKGAKS